MTWLSASAPCALTARAAARSPGSALGCQRFTWFGGIGVSEDAVSYGLKLLRTAGLVTFRKEGRVVYYALAEAFPHPLLEHCLRQLLQISGERSGA